MFTKYFNLSPWKSQHLGLKTYLVIEASLNKQVQAHEAKKQRGKEAKKQRRQRMVERMSYTGAGLELSAFNFMRFAKLCACLCVK